MVKRLSLLPSKQQVGVRFPFGVIQGLNTFFCVPKHIIFFVATVFPLYVVLVIESWTELPGGYSLVKKLSVPLFGIAVFDLQLLIVNLSDEEHFLLEN